MDQYLIVNKKIDDYIKIKAICFLAFIGHKKMALIKLGNYKLDLYRRRQAGENVRDQLVMVNELNGMIYANKSDNLLLKKFHYKKKKN